VTDNTIIKAKYTNKIVSKYVTNNTIIKAKNTNKIVSKNLTDCRKAALQMVIFGIFQASLIFMAKLCHL
jgi:hypoxanthine-guanine phosphoribosyltransferase